MTNLNILLHSLPLLLLFILTITTTTTTTLLTSTYPESTNIANKTFFPFSGDIFTGFITVDNTTGSNLFYELYGYNNGSINNTAPLIIWLQGGPGCSSLFGDLVEIGPYQVAQGQNGTFKLIPNEYTWNIHGNLLFVDQPIGTGFSIAMNNQSLNSTIQAAQHFQSFLIRFYQLYPTLLQNPLYIFGESYAGHYIPAFAYTILQNASNSYIPLTSIGIGDGWVDPLRQTPIYSSYYYAGGLLDEKNRDYVKSLEILAVMEILEGNYANSSNTSNYIADYLSDLNGGNLSEYNYRQYYEVPNDWEEWLNINDTQIAMGIPSPTPYTSCSEDVSDAFLADNAISYAYTLPYLFTQIPVLLYVGQDDDNCMYEGIMNYVNALDWDQITDFRQTTRDIWNYNGEPAGNVKQYGNLTLLTVYKAGHMVPYDQPQNALELLRRWIQNIPFNI